MEWERKGGQETQAFTDYTLGDQKEVCHSSPFSVHPGDLGLSETSPEPRIQLWTAKIWAGWSSHPKCFGAVSLGIYVPTSA